MEQKSEQSQHQKTIEEDSRSLSADSDDQKEGEAIESRILRVGRSIKERRIDKYLHGRFSNFSRVVIQKKISAGDVKVNDNVVKASFKLNPGDTIELTLPNIPTRTIPPEDIPLDIIYEDDDIIVLNKPAYMVVHPARGNPTGTLVNALVFHSDRLSSGANQYRPGIIHRLDRNTTGVMVVAKNDVAHWKIAKQFADRQTKKTYLAIVHGAPELTRDRINVKLGMHPAQREKTAVRPHRGKDAVTFYEVLEEFRGYSFVKLSPETGRTHQLRVHLTHIKHPIVADKMYGGKVVYLWQLQDEVPAAQQPLINRVALHAYSLGFRHPGTGEFVKFEAPLPDDMQNLLDMLRKYRKD